MNMKDRINKEEKDKFIEMARKGYHPRKRPTSFHIHDQRFIFKELDIKQGNVFLDLGCGIGEYALHAVNYTKETGFVYAIDVQHEAIENLKNTIKDKGIKNIHAVVISGGEPTLQNDLVGFAVKIKDMGFLVKLDTNGTNYNAVKKMLDNNCVNFIGLDYKAPIDKYYIASGRKNSSHIENLKSTIKLIVESKIPHEIRTTVHKSILSKKDLLTMREELDKFGVKQWSLQQFNPVEVIDEELLTESTYSDSELRNITKEMNNVEVKGVKYVQLRLKIFTMKSLKIEPLSLIF